jgi:hypothetical protein
MCMYLLNKIDILVILNDKRLFQGDLEQRHISLFFWRNIV